MNEKYTMDENYLQKLNIDIHVDSKCYKKCTCAKCIITSAEISVSLKELFQRGVNV